MVAQYGGDVIEKLHKIRNMSGDCETHGINDEIIMNFLENDPSLSIAIDEAERNFQDLSSELGEQMFSLNEIELVKMVQNDFVNFYNPSTVNPYIPIAARGPWIITSHGAVIHDNGGYGMLGMGHGPEDVIMAMQKNWVMANVMTPSFSQKRLAQKLREEVGFSRGNCPFQKFICLNSGTESVAISMRIADLNAKVATAEGSVHEGKPTKLLALNQAFHGRTQRPAQISDSCRDKYEKHLSSFSDKEGVIFVPANDVNALKKEFEKAEEAGFFIEMMAIEPVMGEGNPGQCISREFYDEARKLTKNHGSLLLVDSIQAGFRGQGCLSIVDYDGFQDCEAPDMETWSKALSAGQYPLSVVGLSKKAAESYVVGVYGNTMTTNPRALETAISVLSRITPELRKNIIQRGSEFRTKLESLMEELPDSILKVQGTGLLLSAELHPVNLPVVGFGSVEEWCRKNGLGVIHGGQNALRFTPHFAITSQEIDMIVQIVKEAIFHFNSKDSIKRKQLV